MLEQTGLVGNSFALILSIIVLVFASELTIKNSVKVADITGFGKSTIGFVLVGFSTSLPELSVSVFAIINPGTIGVAIGNVLGSNIADIALVLGICFVLVAIKKPRQMILYPMMAKEEIGNLYFGLFIASIVPLGLLYIGYASQIIGVILLAIFVFNMIQLTRTRRAKEEGALGSERRSLWKYIIFSLVGITGVIASAFFIVESSSFIATSVGIPSIIIGATIVAFGTSIPELATSISSVRKGHLDLALGDIVGSCFINITFILGVALIASPLNFSIAAFSNLAIFSLITNLFFWYFLSSERIGWREGIIFLFLYAIYLVTTFGIIGVG